MTITSENWYSSWFNTPYYHILYKDRGYEEAQEFMHNLTDFLKLKNGATVLDLACGKGRHSVFLNKLGYNVTGVDLSINSINFAKQFENDSLRFEVHDMCIPMNRKFDAVLNLFTSFGYFENENDNLLTIQAIKSELKTNGAAVIDFMNVEKVIQELVPEETKHVQNIRFDITRYVQNDFIVKEIKFNDEDQNFHFTEKVKALRLSDFRKYFRETGIELLNCFGDYHLNDFSPKSSERLILVFR